MWWLLAKYGEHGIDLLSVDRGGDRALPVFSGEDEAELFVRFGGASEGGWRVRETSGGELISILFGPCAEVMSVALDPSPMMEAEIIDLISVDRGRFLDCIFAPGWSMLHLLSYPEAE